MTQQPNILPTSYKSPLSGADFDAVWSLLSSLPNGTAAKRLADGAIDMCDRMQNLRTSISDKLKAAAEDPIQREFNSRIARQYLERYVTIISAASYLLTHANPGQIRPEQSFQEWAHKTNLDGALSAAAKLATSNTTA